MVAMDLIHRLMKPIQCISIDFPELWIRLYNFQVMQLAAPPGPTGQLGCFRLAIPPD